MKDVEKIKERFYTTDGMCGMACDAEISSYLRGYSEALEWVVEEELATDLDKIN